MTPIPDFVPGDQPAPVNADAPHADFIPEPPRNLEPEIAIVVDGDENIGQDDGLKQEVVPGELVALGICASGDTEKYFVGGDVEYEDIKKGFDAHMRMAHKDAIIPEPIFPKEE